MTELQEFAWQGRTGPFTLLLDQDVFAPTHTSKEVAEALRVEPGETVIDVGCGTGVLSFVAARLGAARVYGTEVNPRAVEVARMNAERLGHAQVEVRQGSLFEPVADVECDVVIGDVSGIPDEIASLSDWFPGGYSGGPTGVEVPVAMVEEVRSHLRPGGRLYLPTGSIQNENALLRAARSVFRNGRITKIRERLLPLPSKIAESAVAKRLMDSGVVRFISKGSRMLWQLTVWELTAPEE